jgi:anti-sigma factor RsiW
MKCGDVSRVLVGYLDCRANPAERRQVEEHLLACAACRTRAEEFRNVWNVLDEAPTIEPSSSFDARVRQRVAAEPHWRRFTWFVPQPRLAFSVAVLLVLSVWIAILPQRNPVLVPTTAANESEQFEEIQDLGVLENYEVLTKFDALSELTPSAVQPSEKEPTHQTND